MSLNVLDLVLIFRIMSYALKGAIMSAGIWKEGNEMILVSSQNSSAGKKMTARKFTKNYLKLFQTLLPSFSFCTRILKAVWNITILSVDIFRASNTMVSVITEDRPCSFVAIGMIAREYIQFLGICNTLFCTSLLVSNSIGMLQHYFQIACVNKRWNNKFPKFNF